MKRTLYSVLLSLALGSAPLLRAEEASDPPPLSPSCRTPIYDIATPAPLPQVAAALRSERRVRVMAIGSSSTVGVGASSPAKAYPTQLEAILEKTFKTLDVIVTNRGVSGELATATAERLKGDIPLDQPDLVLWQVGTNDALAKVPAEEVKATVQRALSRQGGRLWTVRGRAGACSRSPTYAISSQPGSSGTQSGSTSGSR